MIKYKEVETQNVILDVRGSLWINFNPSMDKKLCPL